MQAHQAAGARRQEAYPATEQRFSTVGIENGPRVHLGGQAEADAVEDVGLMRPVITSTLGRWVARIRWMPTARAICASRVIDSSTLARSSIIIRSSQFVDDELTMNGSGSSSVPSKTATPWFRQKVVVLVDVARRLRVGYGRAAHSSTLWSAMALSGRPTVRVRANCSNLRAGSTRCRQ